MPRSTPADLQNYVSEFRRHFVAGARSHFFPAASAKVSASSHTFGSTHCLGVMSSVYGAGYVFHGGDERDQFIEIDRPVFAPLATPSSTLRAQRYALTLVPGENITV